MGKVISIFNRIPSNAEEEFEVITEESSSKLRPFLIYTPPVRFCVYSEIIRRFSGEETGIVEINSDGSAFLLSALNLNRKPVLVVNHEFWRNIALAQSLPPNLPENVLSLQNFSIKLVSLKQFVEQFRAFFSPSTFSQLICFRQYLNTLNPSTRSFLLFVVALILHGESNTYLSAPTPSQYAVDWREQAESLSKLKKPIEDRDLVSRLLAKISQLYTLKDNFKYTGVDVFYRDTAKTKSKLVIVNLVRNPFAAPPLQWLRCWWFGLTINSSEKFWQGFENTTFAKSSLDLGLSLSSKNGFVVVLVDEQYTEAALAMASTLSELTFFRKISFRPQKTAIGKSLDYQPRITCLVFQRA